MSPIQSRGVQAAIAALVIVAVVGVVVLHPTSSGNAATTISSSAAPCSSRIPVDPVPNLANESLFSTMHNLANGSIRSLVFIMQPGTTATLCISYEANETLSANGLLADAVSVNASSLADGAQHSYSVAPNVTFKLVSDETTSAGGSATYSITTESGVYGYYSLSYPGQCQLTPFAVVIAGSPLTPAEFPGFFNTPNCFLVKPFTGYTNITGFSGMTAVWLTG